MKNNKLMWLSLAVLAGLVAVWAMKAGWLEKEKQELFFGSNIDKFCVNELCLEKQGEGWMIIGAGVEMPAETETSQLMAKRLEEIELSELISENEEKFGQLGVGLEPKVIVEAKGKKLEIGDISQRYDGSFVREEGENQVYKINMALDKISLTDLSFWQRKKLTNLPKWQIKKINISQGEKNKELVADKEGNWPETKLIDKVTALDVGDNLAGFEKGGEEWKFEVETEGETKVFWLGKKQTGKDVVYWASDDNKYFWQISQEDFEVLTGVLK